MSRRSRIVPTVILLQMFVLVSHADAQENRHAYGKASEVKFKAYTQTSVEYSDNVFQLSNEKKDKMESRDHEDEVNGRYRDMDSVSDIILAPLLGADLTLDNPFGNDLTFSPSLKYNIYSRNPAANFLEAKLEVKTVIGKNDRVNLEFEWLGGRFKKNYMSGANDRNGNNSISKDERIYSAAVYDEYGGEVAYKHTLLKRKHDLISRVDVEPFLGWRHRIYNSTYTNRNKRTFGGGIAIELELLSRLSIDAAYAFEDVRTRNDKELVLFDETLYGIDANNDGDIVDNAALVTPIDRSCARHSVKIAPTVELTDACKLFLGVEYQWSYFQSENELDIDHYDLWSLSKEYKAGLAYDISKNWSAQLEYNQSKDDTVEEDYTENRFMATVKCRLGKRSP
jgi:opacity protein-like surface antigen